MEISFVFLVFIIIGCLDIASIKGGMSNPCYLVPCAKRGIANPCYPVPCLVKGGKEVKNSCRNPWLVKYLLSGKRRTLKSRILEDCSACGIIKHSEKLPFLIKGGEDIAESTRYPWMVQLQGVDRQNHCAGVILNQFFILTAAHCIADNDHLDVFFQTSSLKRRSRAYKIEKKIIHPDFSFVTCNITHITFGKYDIGLIKMKEKIICDEYKNSICLPNADVKIPVGSKSVITGWGETHNQEPDSEILQKGYVENLNFEECSKVIPGMKELKSHMRCVGRTAQTPCYGDSGGPLLHKINNRCNVIGITSSHTDQSCDKNFPAVYTNVAKFVDWIKEQQRM